MPNDFKTFTIRPMTGVFDTLSSADEIGFGNWRLVKNAVSRSARNRQRGGGWRRLFADDYPYNNEDLHDQLTDRLSFFDTYSAHAMGGGGIATYGYPYFYPSSAIQEHDVFPPAVGPYCGIYYPQYDGLYQGCPIFYPTIGFPYVSIPSAVSNTGLVSHWRFDVLSGSATYVDNVTALDFSRFGTVSPEAGLIGNAAAFHDPATHLRYLYRSSSAQFIMGAEVKFGFTGWINRFSSGLSDEIVLSKWESAINQREYRILIRSGQLRFEVSNDGIATVGVTSVATLASGVWNFFAVWHDHVLNTINVKVNAETTVTASHTTGVFAGGSGDVFMSYDTASAVSTLDAKVDSLSFWKTSFPTEAELTTLYHSGMGLDYPFDMGAVCTTGAPNFYLLSSVYTSCPVHYDQVIVNGYPYGASFPIYAPLFAYDYVYCGDYLHYREGCNEAITMTGEIVSSTGRKLIAGTMSRVYEYNQSAGNWRILADGLGNAGYTADQCGCNSVRGSMATMGLYMLFTNGFDYPAIYLLGESQDNCERKDLVPIADLVALGIFRAGGVVVWKGFAIFFDITEGGTREGGTFIWSDLEDPTSYIESDTSLAGRISVAVGQTILAMAPLGNWLMCYTDKGVYRITLVGGEDIFNVEEIKGVGGNALKFKYSLIVGGSFHMWLGESDVMYFTQFDTAPIHVPWITMASGMIFNGINEDDATYLPINRDACNLVTGGWNEEKREAWLSWPTGENTCPDVTLRFNMKYNTADLVDHGFTSFLSFRADLRPTVGEWMEDMGICPRATQVAKGPKDGPPCSDIGSVVEPAPLYIRNPEESADFPVHPQSLCAMLEGKSMDDFCVDCAAPQTFIIASALDFALKQSEDDYYFRELLAGNAEDYDAYSCTGQYYTQVGYDTVMQEGANDYRTDDEKMDKMIGLEAQPIAQSTPSELEMEIGYGSQAGCLTWVPIRSLDFECHVPVAGKRSDFMFYFPTWRRGRYLSSRFRIGGIGGGGTFSAMDQMIKGWGQQDSP